MSTPIGDTEVFTVDQFADLLQVKPITVLRRIRTGKIEAFQTNGNSGPYRITKEARDKYMKMDSPPEQSEHSVGWEASNMEKPSIEGLLSHLYEYLHYHHFETATPEDIMSAVESLLPSTHKASDETRTLTMQLLLSDLEKMLNPILVLNFLQHLSTIPNAKR